MRFALYCLVVGFAFVGVLSVYAAGQVGGVRKKLQMAQQQSDTLTQRVVELERELAALSEENRSIKGQADTALKRADEGLQHIRDQDGVVEEIVAKAKSFANSWLRLSPTHSPVPNQKIFLCGPLIEGFETIQDDGFYQVTYLETVDEVAVVEQNETTVRVALDGTYRWITPSTFSITLQEQQAHESIVKTLNELREKVDHAEDEIFDLDNRLDQVVLLR